MFQNILEKLSNAHAEAEAHVDSLLKMLDDAIEITESDITQLVDKIKGVGSHIESLAGLAPVAAEAGAAPTADAASDTGQAQGDTKAEESATNNASGETQQQEGVTSSQAGDALHAQGVDAPQEPKINPEDNPENGADAAASTAATAGAETGAAAESTATTADAGAAQA